MTIINKENQAKLDALNNPKVLDIIEHYAKLCQPEKITVITDSAEDIAYVKALALKNQEEGELKLDGHTIHFDGFSDQARDKANTKVLLPPNQSLGERINSTDRDQGLAEVEKMLKGIMRGKEMLVCFFSLGPTPSKFSISALQITDSAYVAHSETILYRPGYQAFQQLKPDDSFFHFIHSAGELDGNVSKNTDQRRVYIDLEEDRCFSLNSQYAGNALGLKKLALRLGIKKANGEDWLCEHMFLMGVRPQDKNRVTYFTGAFPSGCGKTSTAMLPGHTVVGDDIAFLKPGADGHAYSVNVEQGIFGIIADVNPQDDPLIYKALTTPREIIFSNVLINDDTPYWLGMGQELPTQGFNFSGDWQQGKKDKDGNEILAANKNARYTVRIEELENVDPQLHNPEGVPVSGIIYGGRDSDTSPPILQSFSWSHGVFIGAILESETTATVLGKSGVRKHNPMSNLDFLVVPLGTYIDNHLKFGDGLDKAPKIFATNYFLKHDGKFLNAILDKQVWLMWMEGRIHQEYKAIESPIGMLPMYEDLASLFKSIFDKDYSKQEYDQQFSIRITNLIERLERVEKIYQKEVNVPQVFQQHIDQQKQRLLDAKQKYNKDVVSPFEL